MIADYADDIDTLLVFVSSDRFNAIQIMARTDI